jgi:TRAP-type transport system small permease protein
MLRGGLVMSEEKTVQTVRRSAFASLLTAQTLLCELIVLGMVLLVSAEVICRQVFGFSLEITYEIAGYLLAALTYFGLGISLHGGGLFRVDFVYRWIPPRPRQVLQLAFNVISLIFSVILDYQLFRVIVSSYTGGYVEPTILGTPLYIPQLVMPIGVTLMIVVLLAEIREDLRILLLGVHPA